MKFTTYALALLVALLFSIAATAAPLGSSLGTGAQSAGDANDVVLYDEDRDEDEEDEHEGDEIE
ncbi:hypothetical protein [Aquisalimonas sp.]|uniref:hypothetical protein n=1 Tax=unclassified Aquisalimonas TaxID=2644645 RepID=UPI0025BF09A5|nr:hypothetical protein [Aquisalimonas sp.]